MTLPEMTNKVFLKGAIDGKRKALGPVLLPHERAFVEQMERDNVAKYERIVKDKISVTGGDDWHDGAFRATDNEANRLAERQEVIVPYMTAQVVSYPEASEQRVTLGSRVQITQNSYTFPVDIVGFRQGYPANVIDAETNEEVVGMTPESPLAQVLLGKVQGEEVTYQNGERTLRATIERINQTAVKEYFLNAAGVEMPDGNSATNHG